MDRREDGFIFAPAQDAIVAQYRASGRILLSPYRACLVGAHVDHQGGKVTGFALDRGIVLGYRSTDDPNMRLRDATDASIAHVHPDDAVSRAGDSQDWSLFLIGAAKVFGPRSRGFVGAEAGSLPSGGLSSSAAFSLALLSALADVNGKTWDTADLAEAAVRVENDYVGVKCGLLDPTIIANAKAGHMVTLDCQTNQVTVEPGPEVAIVAVYSGIPRRLAATGFNNRTDECREAAKLAAERTGFAPPDEVHGLGDLPRDLLRAELEELPTPFQGRARHFVTEVERVEQAIAAWRDGDLEAFGACARESLESSISNYETGNEEQQVLGRILNRAPGVYGARFCGGGFGGFAAGVSDPEAAEEAAQWALAEYRRAVPKYADAAFSVVSRPSDGLRWLEP
jgi:galactokinase/galacturonokinase